MYKILVKKGDRYSKLEIIKELPFLQSRERLFSCKCDCGKIISVQLNNLRSGNTKSCGCYIREVNNLLEVRKKISDSHRKRVLEGKNHKWKGEEASYVAIHIYIKNYFGTAIKCENKNCSYPRYNSKGVLIEKPKRYEWASMTTKPTRNIEDYKQLCPSCHRKYDLGIIKI